LPGARAAAGWDWSLPLISSISSIGVMPQMASGENWLSPRETAPISFPLMYTGLPLMPLATLVRAALPPILPRMMSCLGAPHVPGNPDDLHRYRLGLRALEYGPGGALHALLDLAQGHDLHLAGFRTDGRRFGRGCGQRGGRKAHQDRGNSDVHGVDNSSCLIVLCAASGLTG
jgi:hypothetical protein